MTEETASLVEFLESEVLLALLEKLDAAFPECGWKRMAIPAASATAVAEASSKRSPQVFRSGSSQHSRTPNRFGPIDQVLVSSSAGLDLDHILKNGRDLPDLAHEIAAERGRELSQLEHTFVWAHGLSRAGAGAARVGAYRRRELAALQEPSPA